MTAREAWQRATETLDCADNTVTVNPVCVVFREAIGFSAFALLTTRGSLHRDVASMQLDGFSVDEISAAESEQ